MSLKVLVVQEDATFNGFILRPLLERLFEECGKARADFRSLQPPPKGYPDATRTLRARFPHGKSMADLWLFIADSDGQDRANEFARLEGEAKGAHIPLFCCAAEPEIEAWLLAGHKEKLKLSWPKVRGHRRLKEDVFSPFLQQHGDPAAIDGGRWRLMKETLRNYRGLLTLCPELQALEKRIRAWRQKHA